MMLKDQKIHEGYWALMVKFGFGAANIGPSIEQPEEVNPTAIVGVAGIGLERVSQPGPLVLDAAVANPKA